MSDPLLYYVALSILKNGFLRRVYPLIGDYSAEDIFYFLKPDFNTGISGVVSAYYKGDILTAADKIITRCRKENYSIIPVTDERYPHLLKEIYDPPPVIYTKGISEIRSPVAVVGTRNSDPQSSGFTRSVAKELSAAGCEIISGMAKGIDRNAHAGCLEAGGVTVGVLANGIDSRYPADNYDIYNSITGSEKSFLVSEYPPGVNADRWTFVRRNRIISGMSYVTVIVKASAKSGALITAKYAVDQNREVFVCPGNVFDGGYAGCNDLLRQGASVFTSADNLLESINLIAGKLRKKPAASGKAAPEKNNVSDKAWPETAVYDPASIEFKIMNSVRNKIQSIDEIARALQVEAGVLNRKLIEMELDGNLVFEGSRIIPAGVK
ncbi:MAG: DNA-processing protein DprA [Spirochaetes bacterium]|nr:DNA-processing protein DprA [Spirochaetota bacterium]